MAKSPKSGTDKTEGEEAIAQDTPVGEPEVLDAEIIDPEENDVQDVPDDEDALMAEDGAASDADLLDDPVEDAATPSPAPAAPPAEQSRGGAGFLVLLLGGVAAGAIGYGIATYTGGDDGLSAQLEAQADQIAALQAQIDAIPVTDLSGVEGQIADVAAQVSSGLEGLSTDVADQVSALDARLVEVEKQPNADGTLSETALAAYQQELDDLRAELDAQQGAVMSAAAQAEADLAAARAEAERLEQEALAAAETAAGRAAVNRIATAVDTGSPFADALADLDGADVPAALSAAAETGVATTAELTADFPEAARAALATARSEGVSDDAGGIGGFLRSQFDVRSTTPQEGSGPDAVLSRAEAAIKEGRVADALAEIEALPEVARAELTDWTARAQARSDVLDAIAALSETYQ